MGASLYLRFAGLALRRPALVGPILGAAWSSRRRDWFRRVPFLPLPSDEYLRWRMETAYGDPDALPPDEELERYLRWAAGMRRRAREEARHG